MQHLFLPLHRKRLSLIQMILQKHLKAGFESKVANRRCDCDGYRQGRLVRDLISAVHTSIVYQSLIFSEAV